MKNQNDSDNELSNLRHKAEMQLPPSVPVFPLSEADTQRLIHELEVHQIELEMQLGELALAKQQLEDAVAQKTVLYDFEPSGYFTLSKEGEITDVNLSGSKMLGKERSGLIGGRFGFFVTDDTKSRFNHFLESAFISKTKETCELTLQTSDHSPKFILLQAIATNNGEKCYVNVVDITDKKLAETLPPETLDRLRQITKSIPSLVYQFRLYPDGRYCFPFASESIRNYYGIIPDDIREDGRSAFEMVHPDDHTGLIASIQASAHDLSPWQHEFRVTLPDGSFQTLFANSLPQREKDGAVLWHGFISDISNKKQVEEELQRVHWRLESIAEATQTGIWEWNIQTDEIVINDLWAQISGYTIDELSPLNIASFRLMVYPDDLKKLDELLARHFSGELPYFDFEGRVKHKDGRWIWIHDRGSVQSLTDDGKPLMMFGTHTDISERKRAEETLFESEKRYRLLFENSLTGIMVTHPDGDILAVNPEACRLFGRTEADICKLGRPGVVDLKTPNLAIALEKRRLTGHFHGELNYLRGDGHVFPVELESGIFTDANGQVCSYNFFRDITERKQNEKILQESEEKYRFMFANNPQPMWIFDLETLAFLEVNQAAVIHYGYSADEFSTMTLKDIRPTEDIPELLKHIVTSSIEYNQIGEFRHLKKNGEIIDVQITWHSVVFNGRKARHVLVHDVTNENRIKASMFKANWRLESVIEGTRVGTWEWNVQTGDTVFNEAWAQMIGYTLIELEPLNIKTWEMLIHPDDLKHSDELLDKHFKGELPYYDLECRMKHKDGSWVWVHDRGRVKTRTDDGKPLMMFGTHFDITERKKTEAALQESEANLVAVFNASDDSIFLLSKDEKLLAINEVAAKSIGQPKEKLIGQEIAHLFPSHVISNRRPFVSNTIRSGNTAKFEDELDGRWTLNHIYPIFDAFGKVIRVAIYCRDITERKLSEMVLFESEEHLQLALTGAQMGMWELNVKTMAGTIDTHAAQILGYQKEEISWEKLAWDNLTHPDDLPQIEEILINHLSGKTPFFESEHRMQHASGEYRWVSGRGRITKYDQEGLPLLISGTILDITDHKQAEDALNESKALYSLLAENSTDAVALISADGKLDYVSPSFGRRLGYEENELNYLHFQDIFQDIHPDDRSRLTNEIRLGRELKLTHGIQEYRIRTKEGSYVWLEDVLHREFDEQGNFRRTIINSRIITERKQAEEALAKRKQQYDNLVAKIPVGVYILYTKPDGTFVLDYVSPRMAEMLNLSVESFLADSSTIFKAIHPDDVDGFRTLSQEGIYQHRPFNWIGRIVADGTVKWMHFRSTPEMLENGEALWHGLVVDITERKQAEEEISLKNEELSNLVAEKDKFFSILAHDLRSPFNSILGFTQILEEDLPTMEFDQIKKISAVLRNSALSAFNLLENLLEWSRMKRGMTSYNPKTFSLVAQIEDSLQVVMELARKKWIEISVLIPEDLQVQADLNMLGSIIRNLISNAIKFTPKYGHILITAHVDDNQNIEISIKDTGIGMNQKILYKLFSNDEHNNRKGTEGESSSGLGLVICKEFVEKHGGRIWAESEEGKGSTFYLTLPQAIENRTNEVN